MSIGTVVGNGRAHGSLYFSDGNIILSTVGSNAERILFWVHQSILMKISPVFNHMLSSPSDPNEVHNGVPLVQLSDSGEDWESLLGILYHDMWVELSIYGYTWTNTCIRTLPFNQLDLATLPLLRGVLAVANKYEMDRLWQQVVLRLEANWPQTLWQWDWLEAEIHAMELTWVQAHGGSDVPYLNDHLPEPVSTIALAHDYNIPTLLPSAFYHLSCLSIYDDRCTTCMQKKEGSYYAESLLEGQCTADWLLLSSRDYVCLLKGWLELSCSSKNLFNVEPIGHRKHSKDNCLLLRQASLLTEIREA